jgi:hypothetical protein
MAINPFKTFEKVGYFPNLLVHGDPYKARRLVASMLHSMYGSLYNERITRFFFQGEDTIKTVRGKLRDLVSQNVMKVRETKRRGGKRVKSKVPPYKTIIIEQAGAISDNIQQALWDLLEINTKKTRFIFISSRKFSIIPLILRRCFHVYVGNLDLVMPITHQFKFGEKLENIKKIFPLQWADELYKQGVTSFGLISALEQWSRGKSFRGNLMANLAFIDGQLSSIPDRIALLGCCKAFIVSCQEPTLDVE